MLPSTSTYIMPNSSVDDPETTSALPQMMRSLSHNFGPGDLDWSLITAPQTPNGCANIASSSDIIQHAGIHEPGFAPGIGAAVSQHSKEERAPCTDEEGALPERSELFMLPEQPAHHRQRQEKHGVNKIGKKTHPRGGRLKADRDQFGTAKLANEIDFKSQRRSQRSVGSTAPLTSANLHPSTQHRIAHSCDQGDEAHRTHDLDIRDFMPPSTANFPPGVEDCIHLASTQSEPELKSGSWAYLSDMEMQELAIQTLHHVVAPDLLRRLSRRDIVRLLAADLINDQGSAAVDHSAGSHINSLPSGEHATILSMCESVERITPTTWPPITTAAMKSAGVCSSGDCGDSGSAFLEVAGRISIGGGGTGGCESSPCSTATKLQAKQPEELLPEEMSGRSFLEVPVPGTSASAQAPSSSEESYSYAEPWTKSMRAHLPQSGAGYKRAGVSFSI